MHGSALTGFVLRHLISSHSLRLTQCWHRPLAALWLCDGFPNMQGQINNAFRLIFAAKTTSSVQNGFVFATSTITMNLSHLYCSPVTMARARWANFIARNGRSYNDQANIDEANQHRWLWDVTTFGYAGLVTREQRRCRRRRWYALGQYYARGPTRLSFFVRFEVRCHES